MTVVERNERVHDYARSLGVDAVLVDVGALEAAAFDVALDFVGLGVTVDGAVRAVRRGGRVVLVGLAQPRGEIDLQAITLEEIELVGSQAGTKQDCAEVLELIAAGRLTAPITQIGFDEIGDGIGRLQRGEIVGRLVAVID